MSCQCAVEHGVTTKTSSTRSRPEIRRNVTTCADFREHREAPPMSLIMQLFSANLQFSDHAGQRSGTDSRSMTATAGHRATDHGCRPEINPVDSEASIVLRSPRQVSIQGFSLYSQCVRPTSRSSRFALHRRAMSMIASSVLPTRQWRQVPLSLLKVLDRGTIVRKSRLVSPRTRQSPKGLS